MPAARPFDIVKELKEAQISILVVPSTAYADTINELAKQASARKNKILYVTLNRPAETLEQIFKKKKIPISHFTFIQAGLSKPKEKDDRVHYLSSVSDLTQLSLEIMEIVKKESPQILVFDSLSTLLVYLDETTAVRFLHYIITELRGTDTRVAFTVLDTESGSELVKDATLFVDKIVDLGA